jgi:hypothetical protein
MSTEKNRPSETVAAIDLGSNSFCPHKNVRLNA